MREPFSQDAMIADQRGHSPYLALFQQDLSIFFSRPETRMSGSYYADTIARLGND